MNWPGTDRRTDTHTHNLLCNIPQRGQPSSTNRSQTSTAIPLLFKAFVSCNPGNPLIYSLIYTHNKHSMSPKLNVMYITKCTFAKNSYLLITKLHFLQRFLTNMDGFVILLHFCHMSDLHLHGLNQLGRPLWFGLCKCVLGQNIVHHLHDSLI